MTSNKNIRPAKRITTTTGVNAAASISPVVIPELPDTSPGISVIMKVTG